MKKESGLKSLIKGTFKIREIDFAFQDLMTSRHGKNWDESPNRSRIYYSILFGDIATGLFVPMVSAAYALYTGNWKGVGLTLLGNYTLRACAKAYLDTKNKQEDTFLLED